MDYLCIVGSDGTRNISVKAGTFFDGIGIFDGRLYRSFETPPATEGRGNFMLAQHREDGSVEIAADPLGTYPLYYFEDAGLLAVSNNVHVLAGELRRLGRRVERAAEAYASFICIGAAPGGITGYDAIKMLPVGARVEITANGKASIVRAPIAATLYADEPYAALLDRAEAEIRENIRAIAVIDDRQLLCDLSGGMDSRLVLAAILSENAQDAFAFVTKGNFPNADANVAALIRQEFGLRAVTRRTPGSTKSDPLNNLRHTLARTGIMESYYFLSPRDNGTFRLSGGLGELIRGFWRSNDKGKPLRKLRKRLRTRGEPYLSPDALGCLHDAVLANALALIDEGVRPEDVGDAFYLTSRNRYHFGIPWSVNVGRFHPLYSPAAMRAAYALRRDERKTNKVAFDLMQRLCPDLVLLPFADKQWHPSLMDNAPPAITAKSERMVSERPKRKRTKGNARAGEWEQRIKRAGLPGSTLNFRGLKEAIESEYPKLDLAVLAPHFDPHKVGSFLDRDLSHFTERADVVRASRLFCAYEWMARTQMP